MLVLNYYYLVGYAISLIYKNICDACLKHDKNSIEKVAYGSYLAGMGFSNVGLGLTHALSNVISAFYDVKTDGIQSGDLKIILLHCPDLDSEYEHLMNGEGVMI